MQSQFINPLFIFRSLSPFMERKKENKNEHQNNTNNEISPTSEYCVGRRLGLRAKKVGNMIIAKHNEGAEKGRNSCENPGHERVSKEVYPSVFHTLQGYSEGVAEPGFQPCMVVLGKKILRRTISDRARYDSRHHQSRDNVFHKDSVLCQGSTFPSSGIYSQAPFDGR